MYLLPDSLVNVSPKIGSLIIDLSIGSGIISSGIITLLPDVSVFIIGFSTG